MSWAGVRRSASNVFLGRTLKKKERLSKRYCPNSKGIPHDATILL
jgi:hypothetical protein